MAKWRVLTIMSFHLLFIQFMDKLSKEERTRRSKIIIQQLASVLIENRVLIAILLISLCYAFLSNLLSNICLIFCDPWIVNVGNAIDDVVRNTCYGIIAGITFFLVNDVYTNAIKKVDDYDALFKELYMANFEASSLLKAISGDKYVKEMNREQLFNAIMTYICNEDDEFQQIGSFTKIRHLPINYCGILIAKWHDSNCKRKEFLATFGDLLTRGEQLKLNRFEDNLATELIKKLEIMIQTSSNNQFVDFRDCDIAVIVNWIIGYKMVITDLAKRYIKYSYRTVYLDRTYIEDDLY